MRPVLMMIATIWASWKWAQTDPTTTLAVVAGVSAVSIATLANEIDELRRRVRALEPSKDIDLIV